MKKLVIILFLGLLQFGYGQVKNDSIKSEELNEVIIVAKNPISEKFSVKKLDKIGIYMNPASSGDALKAISVLPASTNVEETANPSLRGGNPDRSRVYLNGCPVLNPIRFSRDNGLGNFSLFNTEIIDKQYVYASNPPLTMGNSSAGIVQIETIKRMRKSNLQFSVALSSMGGMWNKKWSENSFIQIYGNYHFDKLFLGVNGKSMKDLNSFSTLDFGVNTKVQLSDNLSLNSFNYFVDEGYDFRRKSLNISANTVASKKRFFSVNNLDYRWENTRIRYATMFDYSKSNFDFGNINSVTNTYQYFNAIGIKTKFTNDFTIKYGVETSVYANKYNETVPKYFYALSATGPTRKNKENLDFYYVEPYVYANYEILHNWGISGSIRKNLFYEKGTKSFTSYQFSSHFELDTKNRFIFGAGNYHSYSTPNYFVRDYTLLSSKQIALDYYFEGSNFNLSSAIYYKNDQGDFKLNSYEKYDHIKTFGLELNLNLPISHRFNLNISNSFIDQKQFISGRKYNTALNLKYFIKSQLTYSNPSLFNCSLLFTTRPGNHYTPISKGAFEPDANTYRPIFEDFNSSTLKSYKRIDFSINKFIPFKKSYIIVFAVVNNVLDTKNPSYVYYNEDYSQQSLNHFQRRMFYLGMMYRF